MKRGCVRSMAAALAIAAGWLGGAVPIANAQPTLSHVTPGALSSGATTEVALHGTKLDGMLLIWTRFPAQVEVVAGEAKQTDNTQVVCKLTLGPGVPMGIGGIAVANADGMSDVVYLMIDDLPSIADGGHNHAVNRRRYSGSGGVTVWPPPGRHVAGGVS